MLLSFIYLMENHHISIVEMFEIDRTHTLELKLQLHLLFNVQIDIEIEK